MTVLPILSGLREIAGDYDALIIDLWGVLHDGRTAYPGAVETLRQLRQQGKSTLLLSNAPRRAEALVAMMEGLGFARADYGYLMSSGEAVYRELACPADPWFAGLGRCCLHLGPARDRPLFEGLPIKRVERLDEADFILNTGPGQWQETLDHFVPLLEAAAMRRLPMICANPDLTVIHEGHPMICAGSLARHYEALGGEVRYRGKPDPAIYQVCFDLLACPDRRRILAVGDGVLTDIAGARAVGIDSLFCTGGIHAAALGTRWGQPPDPLTLQTWLKEQGFNPTSREAGPRAAIARFVW